ncbi:post-COAP-1 domain-containing protein [Chloroflexota bacterium]
MRVKYWLVILLAAALTLVAGGGAVAAGVQGKTTTGGGWFDDSLSGNKITFGFNARDTGDGAVEGEFQLVDHGPTTNIHGTFTRLSTSGSLSLLWGTCSIDGEGDYTLSIICVDNGEPGIGIDTIKIVIFDIYFPIKIYIGTLGGGNLQVHKK